MSNRESTRTTSKDTEAPDYFGLLCLSLDQTGLASRNGSLPEGVADYLDAFITRHQVPTGTLIATKSALTSAFGVAPSTLSEAMQILTSRGRVRLRQGPRGGVFVTDSRPVLRLAHSLVQLTEGAPNVEDAADVRDALESSVAHDALRHRTADQVAAFYRIQDEIEQTEDSTFLYHRVLALHAAIAEACNNEFLKLVYLTALRTVQSRAQAIVHTGTTPETRRLRTRRHRVHRALIEAIDTQDVAALDRALRRHATYR